MAAKANENFARLHQDLTDTEDKIASAASSTTTP